MLLWHPTPSIAVKTILCGHFSSIPGKSVSISYYANPLDDIERNRTIFESAVDADGNFKLAFDISHPVCVNAMADENWLFTNKFIGPGDSLFLSIDSASTTIAGAGENGIGAMFEYDKKFLSAAQIKEMQASQAKTDMEYAKYWDDRTETGLAFYKSYFSANPVSAQYARAVEYELKYETAVKMVQFGWRSPNGNIDMFRNPGFMQYFNKYAYNDENALITSYYPHYLDQFTWYIMEPRGYRSPTPGIPTDYYERQEHRDSIARHTFTGKVYDIALYGILYSELERLGGFNGDQTKFDSEYVKTEHSIQGLGKGFKDKSYLKRLTEKVKLANESGKPAYDFAAKALDGKTVKLSDFKGKVVYIDFWSTSCGPCVQEVPHSKKLQQKYSGRNIVFLNVSFDNSITTVEQFIDKKELHGVNTIDTRGFTSDEAKHYHITAIPRYVLVNKDGTIVSSDAPRPSSHPDRLIDIALDK